MRRLSALVLAAARASVVRLPQSASLVGKRLNRRLAQLGLADLCAYREFLTSTPAEWAHLDAICHIPISRFYRDRGAFDAIIRQLLPQLAAMARARGMATRLRFIVMLVWPSPCQCAINSRLSPTMSTMTSDMTVRMIFLRLSGVMLGTLPAIGWRPRGSEGVRPAGRPAGEPSPAPVERKQFVGIVDPDKGNAVLIGAVHGVPELH